MNISITWSYVISILGCLSKRKIRMGLPTSAAWHQEQGREDKFNFIKIINEIKVWGKSKGIFVIEITRNVCK